MKQSGSTLASVAPCRALESSKGRARLTATPPFPPGLSPPGCLVVKLFAAVAFASAAE